MKIKITSKNGRQIDYEGNVKTFCIDDKTLFGRCIDITYMDEDIKTEIAFGEERKITGLMIPICDGMKIQILDSLNY